MITRENLTYELDSRLRSAEVGKHHLSVRWEPGPAIVRVGVMLDEYTWDSRMHVLRTLLKFEAAHVDELAMDFDIFPLEAVTDESYAEA